MMRGTASREQDKAAYVWLFSQSREQHGRIVALSMLCALQAVVLVGFALACRTVIDRAVEGDIDGLFANVAVLASVIIAQLVLRLAINGTQERIRARFALDLRKSMLDSIFATRYSNVVGLHSGELSNRMFSDVQVVSNGVSTIIPSFVSIVAQLVFAIATLALISPPMVALFAGAALLSFALACTLRGQLKELHKTVQEKEGTVRVFLQEALEHQLVIRSFGAQPAVGARADLLQEDHFAAQMRRRGYSIAANASFAFFFNALYVVALAWCAFGLLRGIMSYGTLMAVLQLVSRIQAPVSSLSGMLPQLYQTLASTERLMEVVELPRLESRLPLKVTEFYQRLMGVRINNLAFSYNDEKGEAAGLACRAAFVPKGSFTVVEGASGSGKSTLFKLVLGVYDAKGFTYELSPSGRNTTSVVSCAASCVPSGVFAYVPQDNFLFAGTVRENVAFAVPEASDVQVRSACETACAWDFVEKLPLGLDTVIGEHGQGLSQGQLQRLAIARAVCSGAPIMVLDEVTSALDGETEAAVLSNIAALSDRTVFVAAHRDKVREFATTRLCVEDGVVSERV